MQLGNQNSDRLLNRFDGPTSINWNSWQTIGLKAFFQLTGPYCVELLSGIEAGISDARPSKRDGPDGFGYASQFTRYYQTEFNYSGIPFVTDFPFTLSCWWNPVDNISGNQYTAINISDGYLNTVHLGSWSGSRATYYASNYAVSAECAGPTHTVNNWQLLTARSSSSTSHQLFVNGVQVASRTNSITLSGLNQLRIGRSSHSYGSHEMGGGLAHACVWARALSDAEIFALYDPPTRWDLYYPLARKLWSFPPSSAAPQVVTPTTAALTLTTFAPTVSAPRLCTPTTATLTLTTFAPTVTVATVCTPSTATLTLSTFAPTVSTPVACTPTTAALTLSTFAPTVSTPVACTPTTATLTLTTFAPTVSTPVTCTPTTTALTTSTYAPTVSTLVACTPTTATLALTTFAPTVSTSSVSAGGGNVWLTEKQWALSPPPPPLASPKKPEKIRQGTRERLLLTETLPDCLVTLRIRDRSRWPVNERQVLRGVAPAFREVCTIKDRQRKPRRERLELTPSVPDARGRVRVVGFVDERREIIELVRLGLLPRECLPV